MKNSLQFFNDCRTFIHIIFHCVKSDDRDQYTVQRLDREESSETESGSEARPVEFPLELSSERLSQ